MVFSPSSTVMQVVTAILICLAPWVVMYLVAFTISKFIKAVPQFKMIFSKIQLYVFFQKNWITLLLVLGLGFAFYVWPTPYKDLKAFSPFEFPQRQNRFTGNIEIYVHEQWVKRPY